MFHQLDDQLILESYFQSIELNLDEEFIKLLKKELLERGLWDQYC